MHNFSEKDINQIKALGISLSEAESQIEKIHKGFPLLHLVKPCVLHDGVIKFSEKDLTRYIQHFRSVSKDKVINKFVPASGAASRMFSPLISFVSKKQSNEPVSVEDGIYTHKFFQNLKSFPFFKELLLYLLKEGINHDPFKEEDDLKILECILKEKGLNYSNLPKALIKFHEYSNHTRNPLEEHIMETLEYSMGLNTKCSIHFTISKDFEPAFRTCIENFKKNTLSMEESEMEITFSYQKSNTDTIALHSHKNLFRDKNKNLVFRPGGHGALLSNLQDIGAKADVVFIKNIDNVVPDKLKKETCSYIQAFIGFLVSIQEKIFAYLNYLDNHADLGHTKITEIISFCKKEFSIIIFDDIAKLDNNFIRKYLFDKLNRPIRICGLVKNKGEKGGLPFWVKDGEGEYSLQIVEGTQIDFTNQLNVEMVSHSTHFNPVFIICGMKDYQGNVFDLKKFSNPDSGIISIKSYNGEPLLALEHPGLWNGGMYHWNTIFADIPETTFAPVKDVLDLLKDEHKNC
ncbi:MAG: hypothetical protein ACD_79C00413G0004 [uncultured bacterium]|nr:MAG: hypothetical protein ACD_79C00413G0004 [uncultured bacterium]